MRIFISTGEVSGDLQGAMLIESLYKIAAEQNIDLEIAGLGGDRMKITGTKIIANTAAIGSMGYVEGLPFVIPTIKIQTLSKRYLSQNPPDILVLIDYPTPNLALAAYVKKYLPKVPVVYYIAPQDWAVPMLNNVPKIAKVVDKLLAIFPEEAKYFQSKNINVTWVGHPLLDRIEKAPNREKARLNLGIKPEQQVITLLPASRHQELKYLLPAICQAAQKIHYQLPQIQFLIPVSLENYRQTIETVVTEYNLPATILAGKTLDAIAAADLAITKSGTVNLEIALLDIPQVVIYRVHPLTAWIARKILRLSIPLMSPPNLIVNREIVPEFKQEEVTADNIAREALELLFNQERQQQMTRDYQQMRSLLGTIGVCDRAAQEIVNLAVK
jgi:lipid-A-disaccharide synthase